MLVHRTVDILGSSLYELSVLFIVLKLRSFRCISGYSRACDTAQGKPCIDEIKLAFLFSVGGGHYNRCHIQLFDLLFITVKPAGIQKTCHISAASVPLNSRSKYHSVSILQCLRKLCHFIFVFEQIILVNADVKFLENTHHHLNNCK